MLIKMQIISFCRVYANNQHPDLTYIYTLPILTNHQKFTQQRHTIIYLKSHFHTAAGQSRVMHQTDYVATCLTLYILCTELSNATLKRDEKDKKVKRKPPLIKTT